jgi:phenylpropionate dioxygenase-like ring-hydroxylating dioxygenase large terminal subunit
VSVASRPLLRGADVPPGSVVPVDLDGDELVVWRARSGRPCAMARQCPHLDWDLAEAHVVDDELVCPGHGWSFDTEGNAFKRNLFGRVHSKDRFVRLPIEERDGEIRVVE